MTAYYNEHDAFAAAWLRELIKAGQIAPGEVDERDIRQVEASDLRGFAQCHFFAGIGVWSHALRAAGWPDDSPVWTGSCPCQSFSASGKRGGFSDSRHLWPAWFRLIGQCSPDVLFGEQVASKDGLAWLDLVFSDLEGAGYACGAADTCAAGFGAPHIRSRLYFVAHAKSKSLDRISRGSSFSGRQAEQERLESGGNSAVSGSLAHAERHGRRPDLARREAEGRIADGRSGEAGGMADAADPRRAQAGQHGSGPPLFPARSVECRGDGQLGDSPLGGFGMRGSAPGNAGRTAQPEQADQLEHAIVTRLEGHAGNGDHGSEPGRLGAGEAGSASAPGFTNGFWRNAEWLWCRDKKYRPVEPGTFPLVNGAANRVGRLRGYGNALCAEQAKGFIEAYMEATLQNSDSTL